MILFKFLLPILFVLFSPSLAQIGNAPQYQPANCPSFTDKTSCLKPKIADGKVFPPWCEWVSGACRWSEPNIAAYYCHDKVVHACRVPFCYVESNKCQGTAYDCLNRRTAATCQQEAHCHWYKPGDTPENPNFAVCGHQA